MHFVYIKLPLDRLGALTPDALHQALERELKATGVGALVSWGTSLPAPGAREGAPGSFHRVDVEVQELASGMGVLRDVLAALGAPYGTELHFTVNQVALQQSWSAAGWGEHVPSTGTHRPKPADGKA